MDAIPEKSDASATNLRAKPAVPKKPVNLMLENDGSRKTHVRDMIRKLQAKEQPNGVVKTSFLKKPPKISVGPEKDEMGAQASSQTLEDLKAIDEDIEKLRKQIEERDKIISALREAAEAKDKKLDNLMLEYSKLQSNGKFDVEPTRAASSSPSSPPLCNGELCWTDSFVNKNYHEPVYAQLLSDHTALQKVYNELRTKLESKESEREGGENGINLIMAEQIRALKEREAQLIWEAEELREQNDLMEFRILELEECRKEFLDKEMNEGKHRGEKIVWRERDIEEVSDSGVMSLPTSEDLTSDSELGEAIRNYSPLGPVTNIGLSNPENCSSEPGISDSKAKKSLKFSECLQESGIFVDSESSASDCAIQTGSHSKACQTESVLDKTLLDIIDSSCDLFLAKNPGYLEDWKSDDLSTELSKLSVIQKRIQQKTKPPNPRSPHTAPSCPHSNSLLFYEQRLTQLEDKLKIYESSGDAKDILLARRLEKEVELACRVKELTEKVTSLEATRRKLEEEKCEFEEAENDARFQCQRLEIRLQELIDKNTELELEVERQKVIMNEERRRERKKGSLEGLLNKYEQRNFELEEKELESRQRLKMMEAAMPAIVAYNVFRMVQNPEFERMVPASVSENAVKDGNKAQMTDPVVFQRLEEVLNDQKKLRKDYKKVAESAVDREKALRSKIEELEEKAAKDREMLEEMTKALKAFKSEGKSEGEFGSAGPDDFFEELKHMVANEIQLRAQIDWLEQKEQAYMKSLEKADEIWAGMEEGYKKRLKEAEEANNELLERVSQLETTQVELEKALKDQTTQSSLQPIKSEDLINMQEILIENEKLKTEITRNLDEKFEEQKKFLEEENSSLKEELKRLEADSLKDERNCYRLKEQLDAAMTELEREKEMGERLRKDLEEKSESVSSMEINMQDQISKLTQELSQKSKELSSLEVTVAELREEVETLENKVAELVDTLQTSIKNQDEGLNGMEVIRGNQKYFLNNPPPGTSLSLDSSATEVTPLETPHWVLPLDSHVGQVSLDQKNPFERNMDPQQQVLVTKEEIPAASEIFLKKENNLPNLEILIPSQPQFRFVVFAALSFPRQEMQFVFCNGKVGTVLLTRACRAVVAEVAGRDPKTETDAREEEIFQLSLKNTELQQTLERMEEEFKWKNKEFEELVKIAEEIRREQESLQELYKAMDKQKGEERALKEEPTMKLCTYDRPPSFQPNRAPNIDILQIINPIVTKTSEQISTTISSLQIAFDNLQSKYRSKAFLIKPLLDHLRQKGDNKDIDDMTNQLAIEFASDVEMQKMKVEAQPEERPLNSESANSGAEVKPEGKEDSAEQPQCKLQRHTSPGFPKLWTFTPNHLTKSSSATCSELSSSPTKHFHRSIEVDPDFSFTAPITIIRKVGDDSIFLEWDVTHQPETVIGYEIKVNGLLTYRVRSSTRNKALLHPLNLKQKISIHVFAISENGRSMKSSYVTYPDEYFLLSKECL